MSTSHSKPQLVADYACHTGENPLWHAQEQQLYWTDIPTGRLFRYALATGQHEQIYSGRVVGGFTFHHGGGLLLFGDRGTITLWKDGASTELLAEIPDERGSRFNDVIADAQGRVFCGTMSSGETKGRLYRLDPDGTLSLVLEGIGCSNGMAFTSDGDGFYYVDSLAYEVYHFEYDARAGMLSNRRVFAKFAEADGYPDGLTIDRDGQVWLAFWGGGCIARLGRDGSLEEKFLLQTPRVTSLCFGGPDYSHLYVTTAGGDCKDQLGQAAGALFRLDAGIRGRAEYESRLTAKTITLGGTR